MKNDEFININKVAEAKGLKSNRSLRLEINKPNGKYISREVSVVGGKSYEILFSTLEPEIQEILNQEDTSCKALVPINNISKSEYFIGTTIVSEIKDNESISRQSRAVHREGYF